MLDRTRRIPASGAPWTHVCSFQGGRGGISPIASTQILEEQKKSPARGLSRGLGKTASDRLGPRRHQATDDAGYVPPQARGARLPGRNLGRSLRREADTLHPDETLAADDAPFAGGRGGNGQNWGEIHDAMVARKGGPAPWRIPLGGCRIINNRK